MLKKVEIRKVVSEFVREYITKVIGEQGRASEEEISKAIQKKIVEQKLIKGADLLPVLVDAVVHEEAGRRIRALANPHEQLGLFAKQQAEEQFVRYEDETVGPMEHAGKAQLIKRREDQLSHMVNVQDAFSREERVRKKVLPVMAANDMTFGQACRQLKLF